MTDCNESEERREFAKSLRYISRHPPEWATSACAIAEVFDADYPLWSDSGELFAMLADLIDRPVTTRTRRFATRYGRKVPLCEVCGQAIGDRRWKFCPNCGSEVIGE